MSAGARRPATVLAICLLLSVGCCRTSLAQEDPFLLAGTFYVYDTDPALTPEAPRVADLGLLDAFDFWPPFISEARSRFFEGRKCGIVFLLAASKEVL